MINGFKPETVDFNALVNKNNNGLSLNFQSKMIAELETSFTGLEQKWYIANFYVYLNYHPTNDYPINLENVYKMLGFTTKGNAKRTLENNFVKDEDYNEVFICTEKNSKGGRPVEEIMLNVDTFKNLCMLIKTDKGKEIRKYYVKLENIFNKITNEERLEYESKVKQLENAIDEKDKQVQRKDKLLAEKDTYIAQLKDSEYMSILYIGHNSVISNAFKIGILNQTKNKITKEDGTATRQNDSFVRLENHKSSNPQFEYLFTYETSNAKQIEDLVKLLLKSIKMSKPEWFSITYSQMKKTVDFCIMMYDTCGINDSIENLMEFINRYRSNRLINTNKARAFIEKNEYEDYIKECVIFGDNYRVNTELICDDFYNWYQKKYPINDKHIKLDTGNWSTEFQKEITKSIENITKLPYIKSGKGVSLSDKKRGIYFSKCSGFVGMELKIMSKTVDYFSNEIYQEYINKFITITNNPKNKVARVELLTDFLNWVKHNNFICKNQIYCETSISTVFKQIFTDNIENLTGLKLQDVCKINYVGCFVGMVHSNFECNGNVSPVKSSVWSDEHYIKKYIDSWINPENNCKVSKLFKLMLHEKTLDSIKVKEIISNDNITGNTKKHKWYLVFEKKGTQFTLTENAKKYISNISEVETQV